MKHGHVTPNPDGSKARCGGPALCSKCAAELAELERSKPQEQGDLPELQAAVLEVFRAALASGAAVLGRDTVALALRQSGVMVGTLGVLDALLLLESQGLIKVVGVGLYELTEEGKNLVCK